MEKIRNNFLLYLVYLVKYSLSGTSTFLLDLCIVYLLYVILGWYYLTAVIVSFMFSISINFLICNSLIFKSSKHSFRKSYIIFIFIALFGLFALSVIMYTLVTIYGFPVFPSRFIAAIIGGMINYTLNIYFNFNIKN